MTDDPGSWRLTRLRVQGMRTLADVTLDLDGLTVLIGDNSSGKSTILEALELLAKAARPGFLRAVQEIHGGKAALLRQGARSLRLAATFQHDRDDKWERYEIELVVEDSGRLIIASEDFYVGAGSESIHPVSRRGSRLTEHFDHEVKLPFSMLDQTVLARPQDEQTMPGGNGLGAIDVHLPVDVLPSWVGNTLRSESPLRGARQLLSVDSIGLEGRDLVNAFYMLKNERSRDHWDETLRQIRLGLGDDIDDVVIRADPSGGAIALWLRYRSFADPISARSLSDGTLSWLAFVALHRMERQGGILAFDEPESHLHPSLLMRALDLFEATARQRPVLLATHSDRLLDGLSDPARQVVVCELDDDRATRLRRLDPEALADWLTDYRGLGDLRAAGYQRQVIQPLDDGEGEAAAVEDA